MGNVTPVQWSSQPKAGFSTAEPWIRVNDNFEQVNVARQLGDEQSILEFWRRVIKVRKQHKDLFIQGVFELLDRLSGRREAVLCSPNVNLLLIDVFTILDCLLSSLFCPLPLLIQQTLELFSNIKHASRTRSTRRTGRVLSVSF